ncbi:hypothetical protein GCM10011428_21230 [Streptomyces violaceus]
MPVGVGVGRVRPAGAHEPHGLARLDAHRPGAGQALVTVDDEVQGQLAVLGVPLAHRVRPGHRPLFAGDLLANALHVEGFRVGHALGREQQLHIVVGARARREVGEALAAEHHTLHVRSQPLGADDLSGVRLARLASRSLCHEDLPVSHS